MPFGLALLMSIPLLQRSSAGHMETWLDLLGTRYGLGMDLAGDADLDLDGVPDLVALEYAGLVAFSGASGGELFRIDNPPSADFLHCELIGDTNGDGSSEILLSVRDGRSLHVHSGANGALLYSILGGSGSLGFSICRAGDLDGDGDGDFLASDPLGRISATSDRGLTHVFSGKTGSLLRIHSIKDGWSGSTDGQRVNAAGDLDLDGTPDYMIGAPIDRNASGSCTLVSGATGAIIRTLVNPGSDDWFGATVSSAGDCNGDGIPDQAVTTLLALRNRGQVSVFSGADGSLLWQASGLFWNAFGYELTGGVDVNDDGMDDVATSEWGLTSADGRHGAVHLLSGSDGHFLATRYGELVPATYGGEVAFLGDMDADGQPEFGVSSMSWRDPVSQVEHGRIEAFSWFRGLQADGSRLYSAFGGTVQFKLDFPASLAGLTYALLASGTGTGPILHGDVSIPLTPDIYLRRSAYRPPAGLANSQGSLNPLGDAACSLTIPAGGAPGLIGRTLWFAALIGDWADPRAASVPQPVTFLP